MAVKFDMDVVIFRCTHTRCGEVFEKSLDRLAGVDKVFCPRCGTPANIAEETHLLAAARAAAGAPMDKAAG